MPTWLGIDIGTTSVKAAVVRSAYRKLSLTRLATVDIVAGEGVTLAVRAAAAAALEGQGQGADGIAVAIEGSRAVIRRLVLPLTAQKQLADVLGYELEAQVPLDLANAVFDWRQLERNDDGGQIALVAAVAR